MTNYYYKYDIPEALQLYGDLAIDTEAMGLQIHRDRLCVVQISCGDGDAHIVHFPESRYESPNLKKLLSQKDVQYLFHFGRFDIAIIEQYLGVKFENVFCSKIASRLCRTYTDSHGLKDLCYELLGVKLNKAQQSSYWGCETLTQEQIDYAASDVLYLHALRDKLNAMLKSCKREELAKECFRFLPVRAKLDISGWPEFDIFQH